MEVDSVVRLDSVFKNMEAELPQKLQLVSESLDARMATKTRIVRFFRFLTRSAGSSYLLAVQLCVAPS